MVDDTPWWYWLSPFGIAQAIAQKMAQWSGVGTSTIFPSMSPEQEKKLMLALIVGIVLVVAVVVTWFVWRWIIILKEVGLIGIA